MNRHWTYQIHEALRGPDAAFELALMVLEAKAFGRIRDIDRTHLAFQFLKSPIEMAMLTALLIAADEMTEIDATNVRFTDENGRRHSERKKGLKTLTIELQQQVGPYRVDFFLNYDNKSPEAQFHKVSSASSLIIECDGHEFHERTKEQIIRDRKQDRILQDLGHKIFRYTGSEIWVDADACAKEALSSLVNRGRSHWIPLGGAH